MSVVSLIPNNALAVSQEDLAARVREMADRIEAGQFGDLERVIFVLDSAGTTDYRVYGRQCCNATLVGLLEYTKLTVMQPDE